MFYFMQCGSLRTTANDVNDLEGHLEAISNVELVEIKAFHTMDDRDAYEARIVRERDAAIERQASGYNDSY